MRQVFTSDEIAGRWVAQMQESARSSAHMSFSGPRFYSYGTVIAERVTRGEKTAFLVNSWGYSDSTSRHVNLVRSAIAACAIPPVRVFDVPGVAVNCYDGFGSFPRVTAAWHSEVNGLLQQSEASREPKKTRHLIEAYRLTLRMREFAEFFSVSLGKHAPCLPLPEEQIAAIIDAREAQEEIARRERKDRAHLLATMRVLHPPSKRAAITARDAHRDYEVYKRSTRQEMTQ